MLYDYTATTPELVAQIGTDAITAAETLVATAINSTPRSWDTTIAPLEDAMALLGAAYGQSPFMARVHPDKDVRDSATEVEEQLTKWSTDLVFRSDLYAAVREYSESEEAKSLTGTRARLVEHMMRDFRRAGHELSSEDRAELQRLQQRLIELQVAYSKNLDEWEDSIQVTRDDLAI